ncbi:MAG: M28 family peptidase [Oscillospiraceae bacterium]|nr:M28 family peptidase [Oscillospiraceae bacterium]
MKTADKFLKAAAFKFKESTAWAVEDITRLIKTFGPRAPGSEAEWKAQQDMAAQMEPWADTIESEGFPVHRQAFMGFIPFTVALTMTAAVLFWFNIAWLGLILVTLAAIPLILEFVMYKQFVDRLFKAYPSHNVMATRKAASGTPKKRIFLIGHADSQYEWTLNYKLGGVGMKLVLIPAVVGLIVCFCANLIRFLAYDVAGAVDSDFLRILFLIAGIAMFCLFPCCIGFLFFQSWTKSVPGAADNLSGCYTAMIVLKELAGAGIRFDDTEVVVMLSGSEEAGLRGAKAYVKAHKEELLDPGVQTVCLGLDTFRDLKDIAIYNRDLSGTLRHDPRVQKLMKEAGLNCGHDLPSASIYIGACDAAAFTQGGIPSTGFAAMDPTPPKYYHTRLDNYDILVPEAIQIAAEITMEAVCLFAENGLPQA